MDVQYVLWKLRRAIRLLENGNEADALKAIETAIKEINKRKARAA